MLTIPTIATYGTIIEAVLIGVIIASTLIVKMHLYYQRHHRAKIKSEVATILVNKIAATQQVEAADFKDSWKEDISILLQIVNEFDTKYSSGGWIRIRFNFIKNIILPIARTSVNSSDWSKRHYASMAFTLYSENNDETYILKLLNDSIPLVRYSAAGAGIRYGSEMAINSIITQMSKESWLSQTIYMQGFETVPSATHYFLEKIMKNSNDSNVRASTYNVLLDYPVFEPSWDIQDDIRSPNILLSLAAIRFMAYNQKQRCLNDLLKLLDSSDWRVKTVTLACLGDIKDKAAVPAITSSLNDNNWWVRFSAERALQKINFISETHGEKWDSTPQLFNSDISQQVMNTF